MRASAGARAIPFAALLFTLLLEGALGSQEAVADVSRPHNIIIFVADGLRHDAVNPTDSPTLDAARARGVHFVNSHSLFPTVTMANASAIATGHYLGDTGVFSNMELIGFPIFASGHFGNEPGSPTPFLENDTVLADLDDHFADGHFLNETSLLALAHAKGFNTAAIGKLGPVALQDLTRVGTAAGKWQRPQTIVLDDSTGTPAGLPISPATSELLRSAGVDLAAPRRQQPAGDVNTAGTVEANLAQQKWMADATTRAILPAFAQSAQPFVLLYWSRDPDGTQHNQGDSLNKLSPGINGPTTRLAIANADSNLKQILDSVDATPALRNTTDVFITSDHGFATISKREIDAQGHATRSYAATLTYTGADGDPEVTPGSLPPGFLAIDLAHALGLPLFDTESPSHAADITHYVPVDPLKPTSAASRQRPSSGSALLGGSGVQTRADAKAIVTANGGSDLIYIPGNDRALAGRIVEFLGQQDYVGGLFVDSSLGSFRGALPLSAIDLEGASRMPRPAIVVSFKAFLREPGDLLTAVQIADSPLQEGQGSHGALSRDNTFNNMAAFGPDFKRGFVDKLPVSNADIARTVAHILGLTLPSNGKLTGRVLSEALTGGAVKPLYPPLTSVAAANAAGLATVLQYQQFGGLRYFDGACFATVSNRRRFYCEL
jgi:predicted AlkP superfamily pyrophosphatase or phosphodiesterase